MADSPDQQQRRRVGEMLAQLTSQDVRAFGVEALRRWYASGQDLTWFSVHGHLGLHMVPLLAEKTGTAGVDPHLGKEAFIHDQHEPWMCSIFEFLWWLIRAGLVMPLQAAIGEREHQQLVRFRPTEAGSRLFRSKEDHPVLPGYLARVQQRCPGIPVEVTAHLADATACLNHALGRPAVVLAGLAYETAIDAIVAQLVAKGKLPVTIADMKAAKKSAAVRPLIPGLFPGGGPAEVAAKFAAIGAWEFADRLRDRRNDGAHPGGEYDFSDLTECHEYLLSAGRNLPPLWSVGVR